MITAEESSGTVLHRLIQEQLRYGNPTDARTLLAIQQQALRGGSSGGGAGSPRSSLESLTQEEVQLPQMSARQEPQGQEHQGDFAHSESSMRQLYQLHREELPTYEEAKAHSQYLASRRGQANLLPAQSDTPEGPWALKHGHVRSLSERLLQLSLERSEARSSTALSPSHSYPQLSRHHVGPAAHAEPEAPRPPEQRGPPPEYPSLLRSPGYMLSHSQEHGHYYKEASPVFHAHRHRMVPEQTPFPHHAAVSTHHPAAGGIFSAPLAPSGGSYVAQVERLVKENERLRKELEGHGEKAVRLRKMETEIRKISEAYETLMKGSAKREALEKTMRSKLEGEIKRLHEFNRDLRDRLETASKQLAAKEVEAADQNQHVLAKLIEQNEKQRRENEELEREVRRLQAAGEEQRRCLEMQEQVLRATRARAAQLEEELRRKRAHAEKVERLQGALVQLQAACEKRETLELRLRTRLEQELKALRAQQMQSQGSMLCGEPTAPSLLQQLREREECILALEADITKWEQKYLEESTMRQFAMDAAATAAAQRDTTIIKHSPQHSPHGSFNEDPSIDSHRHQEMENRIRALYAELIEKDVLIKVMQQRLRREPGRVETQGLRPARSVPSISAAATGYPARSVDHTSQDKGRSLSDDQTATVSASSCAALNPSSYDCVNQLDGLQEEASVVAEPVVGTAPVSDVVSDVPEHSQTSHHAFKSLLSKEAEVVEILI
ncbi:angiomotin-like 2a isoform X2 [Scleropages formosus]|uniref:angiomotin-like 2a isoform X2 n=1 Tax=Scleropages formosus TaxID=113540 RepID=UPI0010FAB39B|nr:angiomotin-like 2a isoform X2 [Scleropages formosus]